VIIFSFSATVGVLNGWNRAVYSNSLMATLNARQAIRSAVKDETMSVALRGIHKAGSSTVNSNVNLAS
jgi:hypothetical protein